MPDELIYIERACLAQCGVCELKELARKRPALLDIFEYASGQVSERGLIRCGGLCQLCLTGEAIENVVDLAGCLCGKHSEPLKALRMGEMRL
jgi:hypothetical protein